MTMGPLETADGTPAGPEEARRCFRELKELLRAARAADTAGRFPDLASLSMGMTGDFEAAIEEGAHYIRVGTGLFGSRA
jgi:PLP dependent protein